MKMRATLQSILLASALTLLPFASNAEVCGTKYPLELRNGQFVNICGAEYVNQSIFLFLNIKPGERFSDPNYGFDFYPYYSIFGQEMDAQSLVRDVSIAFDRYFDWIQILNVQVVPTGLENPKYSLQTDYKINESGTFGRSTFLIFPQ